MTTDIAYTPQEWEALQFAPLVTFYAVGWADGSLSRLETGSLMALLANAAALTAPEAQLARDVLAAVQADFSGVLQRLDATIGSGVDYADIFERARKVLDAKAPPDQARVFKEAMMVIAVKVAEAAPLFGKKVTPEERVTIDRVRAAFGLF